MSTQAIRLAVKVTPGASRSEIVGWQGDVLRVRIAAPPDKSKANSALIDLLADLLSVPKHSVQLISGHAQSRKRVEIEGLSQAEMMARLPPVD